MWPVAVFLMGVVLFYWLAFCGTIWFWANGVFSLCKGHFIRASIWCSLGGGMLLWWQGTEVIPHPWDFDAWLRGSACFVGLGVILTLLRCFHKFNRERRAGVEPEPQVETPMPKISVEVSRPRRTIKLVENDDGVWVPEDGKWTTRGGRR